MQLNISKLNLNIFIFCDKEFFIIKSLKMDFIISFIFSSLVKYLLPKLSISLIISRHNSIVLVLSLLIFDKNEIISK